MVSLDYSNAYTEVLEILNYISDTDYNKIPKNKIDLYRANSNKDYSFTYNPSKTLDEQNVSKLTKGIIAILFRDYWATEIQRQKIISKQKYDRKKLEEQKQSMYNPNNIFKSQNITSKTEDLPTPTEFSMIEYKESFFKKIINKIKNIFYNH